MVPKHGSLLRLGLDLRHFYIKEILLQKMLIVLNIFLLCPLEKNIHLFLFYEDENFACIYISVPGALRGQKKMLDLQDWCYRLF